MDRVIFHIDVNSAFLSWTAVQRLSWGETLDIRTVPSVVSGEPNDRRSIITAKSIPAKKYGINTAEPVSMAMRKCQNLIVVRGDWEWYKKCSEAFIAICKEGLRSIGLDGHEYSAHSLRHTTGTQILLNGGTMFDVQNVLRHTTPATSQLYVNTIMEDKRLDDASEQLLDGSFKKKDAEDKQE